MPFILAFVIACALTPIVALAAARIGLVDRPAAAAVGTGAEALKIHDRPVPLAGGIAIVAAAVIVASIVDRPSAWLAAATFVALAIGVLDDARPLPAWVRVQALLAAGVLLAAGGWTVEALGPFAAAGTVAITLATANAMNLIDGQDGLAGGVGAASALGLAAATAAAGSWDAAVLPLALGGALLGFLVWNLPPARVFMGNGGAYGVGVILAASAAVLASIAGWRGLVAAALCLSIPAFEVASTVVRRLRSGTTLTAGDRAHSYDVVAERWGSRSRTTLAFVAAATLMSMLAVLAVWRPGQV